MFHFLKVSHNGKRFWQTSTVPLVDNDFENTDLEEWKISSSVLEALDEALGIFVHEPHEIDTLLGAEAGKSLNKLRYLVSDGRMQQAFIADQVALYSSDLLTDRVVQTMCLMMTQSWVEPNFEGTYNGLTRAEMPDLLGEDRFSKGNCVECSVVLGINFHGGIEGRLVPPRLRIVPSYKALCLDPPRINLQDLDPLSEQTLPSRVFGTETPVVPRTSINECGITEDGAVVTIPGHAFFVRLSESGLDVYDTAMGFAGPWDVYESFMAYTGQVCEVTSVCYAKAFDRDRVAFPRLCRDLYRDPAVEQLAIEYYSSLDRRYRDDGLVSLYGKWNLALGASPDKIAQAFQIEYSAVQDIDCPDPDLHPELGWEHVQDLLAPQERGFVCLEVREHSVNTFIGNLIVFKQDETYFVSCHPASVFTDDIVKQFKDKPLLQTASVLSFGGNDLARMHEIYSAATAHPAIVRLSIHD